MRRRVALALLLAVVGIAVVWFVQAWSVAVLDSDSMEPWAEPGALLVHRIEAAAAIEVDDVVTVRVPDRGLVTHRVVRLQEQGGARIAVLRGDASRFADPDPVTLPDEVDRVVLVVPQLGTVLRVAGPWLLAGGVLLAVGALALGLTRRHAVAADVGGEPEAAAPEPLDPRIEALLATCEQLLEDGVASPVVSDLVRVRTAPVVGLPIAERSGAVLSLDDGGRFYVLAVADADQAMLDLVPVDSARRRDGTAALDLWWDAVHDGIPPEVRSAIAAFWSEHGPVQTEEAQPRA